MSQNNAILITNIGRCYGISESPYSFKKGKDFSHVEVLENAWIYIQSGRIVEYGTGHPPQQYSAIKTLDAKGGIALPSYVDTHTHIVFPKSRHEEYVMRIKGKSYEEIAKAGGGILNSAKAMQHASVEELYQASKLRLNSMIAHGTGVVEIKSGYGLTKESEIKMLEVIQLLKEETDVCIKATFLGAHAIPLEYKSNRAAYIDLLINEMLPEVAQRNLAEYCDVFCDEGFFTIDETRLILNAANQYGLKPKIHANELGVSGGVQVGVECDAISVDHLECTTEKEWEALAGSKTIPTLLPGTSFFLGIPFGAAREMIDYGLGLVLASDFNPGSTPSGDMQFVQSLGCIKMKMTPEEAFNAVTYNAAAALECQHDYGSITKGKIANIQIHDNLSDLSQISYYYGQNTLTHHLINGKLQLV